MDRQISYGRPNKNKVSWVLAIQPQFLEQIGAGSIFDTIMVGIGALAEGS